MFVTLENRRRIELRLNEGDTARSLVLGTFDDLHIAQQVQTLMEKHMKINPALNYLMEVFSETQG